MTVTFLLIDDVTISEFCVAGTLTSLFPEIYFMTYLMACVGLAHLTTLVVNEELVPSELFKLEQLSTSGG